MKVLITGFAGHIGSALIRNWPDAELTLLDNFSTQRYCSLFGLDRTYRLLEGSVNDAHLVSDAVKGQDAVVHLAALTDAASSMTSPDEYLRVNIAGTEVVAAACVEHGVPLVFLSTTSVYGEQAEAVDETLDPNTFNPQSVYAYSKWAAEGLLRTKYAAQGLQYTTLRCGTIYGTSPGMRFHTFVNKACWQAAHGLPIPVYRGAWDSLRPYLALGDCIEAIRTAAAVRPAGTFNVLTGNHTPRDVIAVIRNSLPDTQVTEVDAPFLNQTGYEVHSRRALLPLRSGDGTPAIRADRYIKAGIADTLRLLKGTPASDVRQAATHEVQEAAQAA